MSKFQFPDEMLLSIIDAMPIGIFLATREGEIIFSNPKAEDQFGFNKDELLGCSVNKLVPARYRKSHEKMRADYTNTPLPRAMGHGRILSGLKKNGQEIQIEIGLTTVVVDENKYVLVSIIEVSNEILKVSASNDSLTGLPNRNLFEPISENLRNLAIRNGVSLSLMFIDLDGFKGVNDQYGHDVGDLVLCEVAGILRKRVRKNDIIARIGGDEFTMCLYGIENNSDLIKISKNLITKISSLRNIKGRRIGVSACIGAVITDTPDRLLLDNMIKIAIKLMYKAKKAGKGRVFTEEC